MKINLLKFIKVFKYSAFTTIAVLFSLLPTIKNNNQFIEPVHADIPIVDVGSGDGSCGGGDGI